LEYGAGETSAVGVLIDSFISDVSDQEELLDMEIMESENED
jgi:hypothetical protein